MTRINVACGLLLALPLAVMAYEPTASTSDRETANDTRQYIFSWKFIDGDAMAPRGGTTRGEPLTLATEPSKAWHALQAPGLTRFERDRRAILAMSGEYRVSFDFIEVAGFVPDFKPSAPYQSWATEKVYVLEDEGERIVLQHLLVMRVVKEDGSMMGPFVTKHWRQDWIYEPEHLIVYAGKHRWDRIAISEKKRSGQWAQLVYQVDDSPRYGGIGRWQHEGNYSSWLSDDGWRPLPRREWSVRQDYDLLIGSNRHTITPTGWVHEQQNNKVVLNDVGQPRAEQPVLARELGYNRYELLADADFLAGDSYLAASEPFWKQIRAQWALRFERDGRLTLSAEPDQGKLFMPAFMYAEGLGPGNPAPAPEQLEAKAAAFVDGYFATEAK